MRSEQANSKTRSGQKAINPWKWAFITLVLILIGFIVYFVFLIQPYSINQQDINQSPVVPEELTLTTSLSKEDTEVIINEYLTATIGPDFEQYEIVLNNHLEVNGAIEIFTLQVPFVLAFTPYALEDGNLQLRGENVELANFSLPVGAVMNLFARQIDLPDFIEVDGNTEIITIHLDDLMAETDFQLTVNQLDLEENVIEFNLGFDKRLFTEQRN